jgi:hypothetical protein
MSGQKLTSDTKRLQKPFESLAGGLLDRVTVVLSI